jgi:threonine/homoserine/homoserine lactone efflux protein
MNSLFAIAAMLCIAAITPGPNNLVVMRTAARSGFGAALPATAGIVLGGVALLAMAVAGADAAFAAWPPLRTVISMVGVCYLAWLGIVMIVSSRADAAEPPLPAGIPGLFAFQFFNPKAWTMVLTVVASTHAANAPDAFLQLAPLFVGIPVLCLLMWAALGSALARFLAQHAVRRATDSVLGALLVLSSLLLLI